MLGGWLDPRATYGGAVKQNRYEIKWRYGKWRVIDTHTNTVLIKVNTKALAETYLRLLGESDEAKNL
jgi:hypothetical protein